MNEKKIKLGIITPPFESAGNIPFRNLIEIFSTISNSITIISGKEALQIINDYDIKKYKLIDHKSGGNAYLRIKYFVLLQFRISYFIIKYSKYVNFWFLFLGAEVYLVPLLICIILKKPVYCILCASVDNISFYDQFHSYLTILAKLCYALVKKIIIVTPRLISEWKLNPYEKKIVSFHHHHIDLDKFYITQPIYKRPELIGYIGRLSEEKGFKNFVSSLPIILREKPNYNVLIGGEGKLKEYIIEKLNLYKISERVTFSDWISHDILPQYLNKISLLIIPSYTESGPLIMLEALACGTPVLATPVGMVPDYIKDGESGFIMESNSAECIAINVIRALNYPDVQKIVINGRKIIENNFEFGKIQKEWKNFFYDEFF